MTPRFKIAFILLLPALAGGVKAQAQNAPELDEMEQLLQLLEQQTSLATQTRLNADFVPGMLSVFSAEQMQRRGFRTVWEALGSIPGVRTVMNETGMRSISVRGIGQIFEPSKVKLLLNGKSLNASAGATTGTLYDTPVEQVERIEFIRGPGSATHGEFAYAGVLNVVTRQQGEQYAAGFDSDNGVNFAALYSYARPENDFRASVNLAASDSEGADIDSEFDRSPAGVASYAPGPINNGRDFVSAIFDVEAGSLNALLQFQQGNRGDHFGTNNLLPPNRRQTVISDNTLSADLGQTVRLDPNLSASWSVNLLQNKSEQNGLFLGVAEIFGGLGDEDDIVADTLLEERRFEARTGLQYSSGAHRLSGELVFTDIEVTTSEQFINLDPNTNLPSPTLNAFPGPVGNSEDRRSKSLVLQDEYRIDDSMTLTGGLRFDDYEDVDSNLSPRIALVWRRSENHILKTQLARAFRPPSLIETGGAIAAAIDPEVNDSFEFGHIYHRSSLVVRNTVYFTRLEDLIVFQDYAPFGYKNTGSFDLRGYELEVENSIGTDWDFNASLSLQDYRDGDLPGAAPWMFKLGVGHQLLPLTRLHLQLNSIASRVREQDDPRSDFEQMNQVDITLLRQNFLDVSGLNLRLGLNNLLDEELKHPSTADTYPGDYPYSDGVMFWARLVYRP